MSLSLQIARLEKRHNLKKTSHELAREHRLAKKKGMALLTQQAEARAQRAKSKIRDNAVTALSQANRAMTGSGDSYVSCRANRAIVEASLVMGETS